MKTKLFYGLAIAFSYFIVMSALFFLGLQSDPAKLGLANGIVTVVGIGVTIGFLIVGTREVRAEIPEDKPFPYSASFATCFQICLFSALAGIIFTYVYMTLINPTFSDVILQAQIAKMRESHVPEDQIENAKVYMAKFMSPVIYSLTNFVMGLIFSTLLSLIVAIFLKRPAPAKSA